MDIEPHSIADCYRCPRCKGGTARHDRYCRKCGLMFTAAHLAEMKQHFHLPLNVSPWNVRDRFRCIYCDAPASIHDVFCRMCGNRYGPKEIAGMRENMSIWARLKGPFTISVLFFVLLFICFLVETM